MTWPPAWTGSNFKQPGGRTKITLERRKEQEDVDRKEEKEKRDVRTRDRGCRFPLCGCRKKRLPLEVSHSTHKGTNARATRILLSVAALMVQLCKWRHQDGAVSIHHKTMRHVFLTPAKFNGPIAWEIQAKLVRGDLVVGGRWVEVAREASVGVWLPFTEQQRALLEQLAEMEA